MMKRITFVVTALLMLSCVSVNAQSINNPIKGDINEDGVVNAADVVALVDIIINGEKPEQGEIVLSNSELSSRLKDKNGNPVLLTSRGKRGYRYTSDGRLAVFGDVVNDYGNSEEHFVVDGLTFKSENIHNSGSIERFNGNLELNQDGLITKAVVVFTGIRNNGQLKDKYSTTHSFVYNTERQLLKIEVETKDERYDENGNLSKSGSGQATLTYTWENGNLLKVEISEDEGTLDQLYHNKEYTYNYSKVQNVTKQPLKCQNHLASDFGINHLYGLGLFGVGPAYFPTGVTFTLNENGTINTEGNSQYTYAEP